MDTDARASLVSDAEADAHAGDAGCGLSASAGLLGCDARLGQEKVKLGPRGKRERKGKEPPRLTPHRCHAPTHSPAAGRAVAYPPGLALGGCLVDAMSFSHRPIRGPVMSRG